MLDFWQNIAIYGLALLYMLGVGVFALACVRALAWFRNNLEDWFG